MIGKLLLATPLFWYPSSCPNPLAWIPTWPNPFAYFPFARFPFPFARNPIRPFSRIPICPKSPISLKKDTLLLYYKSKHNL